MSQRELGAVECRPLRAGDAPTLAKLFERCNNRCFCGYWQYPGDHREWQMRCASEPQKNRSDLGVAVDGGALRGVVALSGDRIIGWCRFDEPQGLTKLYQGRLYRGLPCLSRAERGVATVACLLVEGEWRRAGIARRLVSGLIEHLRGEGYSSIEAFPRGATDVTDEEQWMGPAAIYEELGFERVHEFAPYPVFRLPL